MHTRKGILIFVLITALTFGSLSVVTTASASTHDSWNLSCNPDDNVPFDTQAIFTGWTTYSGDCKVSFTLKNIQTGYTCTKNDVPLTYKNGKNCADWTKVLDKEGDWKVTATIYKKTTFLWWTTWEAHDCAPKIVKCIHQPTINDYVLECTPSCDQSIELGTQVTVKAKTSNMEVCKIDFWWMKPDGTTELEVVSTFTMEGNMRVFTSMKTLNILGDWTVYADFIDKQYNKCHSQDVVVACRHCTFNVVPEVPLLGTIGASAAMFGGFAALKLRRKPKK